MTNRLAHETSPYLLQHAHNPVDWYPWGSEALERAKMEQKPIFLSIGYSACHWCHVMERESFENQGIANFLKEHFVCIKVDREERPDLDQIYMQAVQMITGRGGWPMSVFLTPNLQPFFGGTYWPAADRMGIPGFARVLQAVLDAWQNRREQVFEQARSLTESIVRGVLHVDPDSVLTLEMMPRAADQLHGQFDFSNGGFGQSPKFPHSMCLQFLLRYWSRSGDADSLKIVKRNLDMMARGGIYDQLAGGFARYSVDAQWLVPHFEKMLYDNALLVDAYLDGFLATGEADYAEVVRETIGYVVGYMTDVGGAFHSAEDADSEGEEGKFYVWSRQQIVDLLGEPLAQRFCDVYDVTDAGNFEGHNILHLRRRVAEYAQDCGCDEATLNRDLLWARKQLLAARDQRVRPAKDDKVLANWNGLMIHAMARAGAALRKPEYVIAAARAGEFIWNEMRRADGRLLHAYRAGRARFDAYLDDYACLAQACTSLYEATFAPVWLDRATELAEEMCRLFADSESGGFYYTAIDHETPIARTKEFQDSSVPSGNGMAATVLARLGRLTGREEFLAAADGALRTCSAMIERHPIAAGQALIALDWLLGPVHELALITPDAESLSQLASHLRERYLPRCVIAGCSVPMADAAAVDSVVVTTPLHTLLSDKSAVDGQPTLYVCQQFSCQEPAVGALAVQAMIQQLHVRAVSTSAAPAE